MDLGQAVAVPFAAQCLGQMGAEVIRVESNARLGNRVWPPFADDVEGVNRSGLFNQYHGNKLSCTVNLRTEAGRDIVRSLVPLVDVVAENYSTGTMERLGFGYQDLTRLRPDIIMLSMSAAGRTGPLKDFVGFHSSVLMFSGLAAITGYPGGHPRIAGSVFPDPISGMYAIFAVLGALYRRRRTGLGKFIDLAMTEAMMSLMPEAVIDYTLNSRRPERSGNADPAKAPHGVYRCKGEDAWIAISVDSDERWGALCDIMGRPEWTEDARFSSAISRQRNREELDMMVQELTRERDASELMRQLQDAGVPAGVSQTTADLLEDPHLRERDFFVEIDHPEVGRRVKGNVPWKISGLPAVDHRHAPLLGQDNHYVLCELLGLPEAAVNRLVEEKVVH